MIGNKLREPGTNQHAKGGFLHNVAARLIALALWKAIVLLAVLVLGTGAAAAALAVLHHRSAQAASTGVVLEKLVALGDFHAAQAVYTFNFPYVVHKSFLFITGETIQVAGSGTDDAIVPFSALTEGGVVRQGTSAVTLLLPSPRLGTPAVNLGRTTLSESGGLLTHLSHLLKGDPNDARLALAAAQNKIAAAAAADSQLISKAETSTRDFLARFLRRLGYSHVTVVFG